MADNKTDKTPREKDDVKLDNDDDFFISDSTKDTPDGESVADETTDTSEKPEKKAEKKADKAKEDHKAVASDDTAEPSATDLDQAMTEAEQEAAQPADRLHKPKAKHRWSRKKIALTVTGALVAVIAILMIIPVTRYAIAGVIVKRDVTVTLKDSKTNKPVSNVALDMGGATALTDAKGQAILKSVPVGSKKLTASKKYYKTESAERLVPITGANPSFDLNIEATGRQVPVKVQNKLTKQPLENAQIDVDGASSKTDKNGDAVLVLPADKTEMDAKLTLNGYNAADIKVTVTEQADEKNTFTMTAAGKLYFLSKRSGKVDVLSSNLDGTDAKTVLAGTGKENSNTISLLASRDWKYLALQASRDSDRDKLYLIETATDKLSVIDEGPEGVGFTPVGWHNSHFIYTVYNKTENWQPNRESLKSFNASSGNLTFIDRTAGEGSDNSKFAYEQLGTVYILNNELVYAKSWTASQQDQFNGKNSGIYSVRPDGSNKKAIKTISAGFGNFFGVRLYKPQDLYIAINEKYQPVSFWEYENSKLAETKDMDSNKFNNGDYLTFFISPSSNATFWSEPRDGKNTLFIGNAQGEDGRQIATLSEYTPYGWYGNDYLLVTKGKSELFIMSRSHPEVVTKVSDYHKPQVYYYGYGYGYGGF